MAKEEFMEIGVVSLRDPVTRDFGEPFPLYMKATDAAIASREKVIQQLGRLFADKIREYEQKCREAGAPV